MRRADLPAGLWTYYNQNDKKTTRRPKRGNAEKRAASAFDIISAKRPRIVPNRSRSPQPPLYQLWIYYGSQ